MQPQHPIINGNRECAKCKRTLPVSAFNHLKRSATGLDYHCRDCRQAKKVEVYNRKAVKVSDVRRLVRQLIEEKSFTYVDVSK